MNSKESGYTQRTCEKCEIVRVGESTSDKEKHDNRALENQKGGVLSQLMAEHHRTPLRTRQLVGVFGPRCGLRCWSGQTSCGIRNQCVWQKVSGSEQASTSVMSVKFKRLIRAEEPVFSKLPPPQDWGGPRGGSGALENAHSTYFGHTRFKEKVRHTAADGCERQHWYTPGEEGRAACVGENESAGRDCGPRDLHSGKRAREPREVRLR